MKKMGDLKPISITSKNNKTITQIFETKTEINHPNLQIKEIVKKSPRPSVEIEYKETGRETY